MLCVPLQCGDYHEVRDRTAVLYRDDFLAAFAGWNAAAERAGVTIVNATRGSGPDRVRGAVDLDDELFRSAGGSGAEGRTTTTTIIAPIRIGTVELPASVVDSSGEVAFSHEQIEGTPG